MVRTIAWQHDHQTKIIYAELVHWMSLSHAGFRTGTRVSRHRLRGLPSTLPSHLRTETFSTHIDGSGISCCLTRGQANL